MEARRDPQAAAELRWQAREAVAYIAAHIASPELRATFLDLPGCRALGDS